MIQPITGRAISLDDPLPCAAVTSYDADGRALLCADAARIALAAPVVENGEPHGDWRLTPLCAAHVRAATTLLNQLATATHAP